MKSFQILIKVTLFVLLSQQIYSQTIIKGRVVTQSGIALPYASIEVLKDTNIIKTSAADSLGGFQITLEAGSLTDTQRIFIRALYINSFSQLISVTDVSREYSLQVTDTSRTLGNITVQATQPVFLRKADRFVYIPDRKLYEGNNMLDVMRHAPLLRYNSMDETLSIIGKTGTVVYINNKKTAIPNQMLIEMLQAMPAENIKSIEIITNPGSEYQANTSGGIVNINMKRQLNEGWLGNLSLQTQQSKYNTAALTGSVGYSKGKVSLQLIPFINNSFNYYTNENRLTYQNGDIRKLNTDHKRLYFVAGGGVNIDYNLNERNFISYNGWFSDVSGRSDISTKSIFYMAVNSADSFQLSAYRGKDSYTYNFGNFNYHTVLNKQGSQSLDLNFDYNNFYQKQDFTGSFKNIDSYGHILNQLQAYHNILPQKFSNFSERIEYAIPLDKKTNFSAGIQNSNTAVNNNLSYYITQPSYGLDSSISNHYRYSENYMGAYINISRTFTDKWSASAGVRFENTKYRTAVKNRYLENDSNYLNLFPSASVSYSLNAKNQFGASFSRKIGRPNFELLFPGRTYYGTDYFSENNPFLKPVIFYNTELSYTLNSRYTLQVSYVHTSNDYFNFIVPVLENNIDKLKSTYLNYGSSERIDVNVNMDKYLIKDFWEIVFAPSFHYNHYRPKDDAPVEQTLNNYSFNIFYDNYFYLSKKKKWTAFLTFKYNSKSRTIASSTDNITSSLDFEVKKVLKNFSFYLILSDIYRGNSIINNQLNTNLLVKNNYSKTDFYSRAIAFRIKYNFGNTQVRTNKQRNIANDEIKSRTGN